ncbi:MAG: hypothetical protein CNLJKLNK_01320 [Holosporales bacterium]
MGIWRENNLKKAPPSQDPNRDKNIKKQGQKPGGQVGHTGATLMQTKNPDEIIDLYIDLKKLPKGEYKNKGYEEGKIHKAPFPENGNSPGIKKNSLKIF